MKEIIHIGINRGFGIARGLYEKKLNNKDFEFNYSFSKAARISKNAPPSSPERIICEKLVEAHEMGAICLLEESLGNLKIKNKDKLIENLKSLKIMYDKNKFYFRNYLEIEKSISYKIKSFLLLKPSTTINPVFPKSPKLSELQEKAITKSLNSVFSIITGGPGTGKTTIIKVILNNLIKNSYDPSRIQIITPTGKAAKRVQESAQELFEENFPKPKTIHKLISFNPGTGKARFDNENPLDLDVLILDEASMADIFILNLLLEAFPSGEFKKIIFVGDPDQLLPVNSGAIFTDLVLFRKNVSELNISFRQDKDSGIINEIAKEINSGKLSGLLKYESFNIQKFDKGLQFILTEKTEEIIDIMNKWYEIYPKGTSQILTPFNKGKLGIDGINSYFTDKLDEKEYPAILIKNLSEFLLYNGETGYLIQTENNISFRVNDITYNIPLSFLDFFLPAYAITIHKSQGSEYDHVCIIIPGPSEKQTISSEIFTRRLLYTAITRAKKSLTIIGSKISLENSVSNEGFPRYSGLIERIKENK